MCALGQSRFEADGEAGWVGCRPGEDEAPDLLREGTAFALLLQ
ncbi:hypothetical protein [Paenibacillus popilliae]|nr:hypothetical protein [Paenibacillus popilliae]